MAVRHDTAVSRSLAKQLDGLRQALEVATRYGQPVVSYVRAIEALEAQQSALQGALRQSRVSRKDRLAQLDNDAA